MKKKQEKTYARRGMEGKVVGVFDSPDDNETFFSIPADRFDLLISSLMPEMKIPRRGSLDPVNQALEENGISLFIDGKTHLIAVKNETVIATLTEVEFENVPEREYGGIER